jgi:DNA-binding PadR family transcriptional regulator
MSRGEHLGEFEQFVLLALVRLGEGAYGLSVRKELAERAGRDVAIGAVYATLDRLERKGLVVSELGAPTAERGGRAKRHFRLTGEGAKALKQSQKAMARMLEGLPPKWRPA